MEHEPAALRGPPRCPLWLGEGGKAEQQSSSSSRAYRAGLRSPDNREPHPKVLLRAGATKKEREEMGHWEEARDSPLPAGGIPVTRSFKPCP